MGTNGQLMSFRIGMKKIMNILGIIKIPYCGKWKLCNIN